MSAVAVYGAVDLNAAPAVFNIRSSVLLTDKSAGVFIAACYRSADGAVCDSQLTPHSADKTACVSFRGGNVADNIEVADNRVAHCGAACGRCFTDVAERRSTIDTLCGSKGQHLIFAFKRAAEIML